MSNPITSQDLYQPGSEDTLKKLRAELEAIQKAMQAITVEARTVRESMKLLNAANNPQKVITAATEAQRLANAKSLLETKKKNAEERIAIQTAKQKAIAETKANREIAVSEQKVQQEKHKTNILREREIALINRNNQATKSHSSSLRGLLSSLRSITYAYFSLAAAQQIVGKLFSETKQLNTLDIAMRQTLGTMQEVAAAQEFLVDISTRYGADLLTTSNAYLKFGTAAKQAGVSSEETKKIFESVTKASSVLGLGAERTSYVFLALEQIMSKGRLSTEELRRQLGEHLPGAFGIAAQAMGVTTEKLTDMLKKGQIASTDFLPKFVKQLELTYGIANVQKVDNLAAAQGRFNNELTLLIRDLDVSDSFKGFFDILASGVKFVRENSEAFIKLGQAIIYVATAWVAWNIGSAIKSIGSLRKAIIALGDAIKANPAGALLAAITAVIGVVDLLTDKFDGAKEAKRAFNDAIQEGVESTNLLKVQVNQLAAAYVNENTSAKEKAKILKQLNDLGIEANDINKDGVISNDELTASIGRQIEALKLAAQIRFLENTYNENLKNRNDLLNKKPLPTIPGLNLGSADIFFGTSFTEEGRNNAIQQIDIAQKEIEAKLRELYKLRLTGDSGNPLSTVIPTGGGGDGEGGKQKDPRLILLEYQDDLNKLKEDGLAKDLETLRISYEKEKIMHETQVEYLLELDKWYQREHDKLVSNDAEKSRDDLESKGKAIAEVFESLRKFRVENLKQGRDEAEEYRKNSVEKLKTEFDQRRDHEKEIFELSKHTKEEEKAFAIKQKIEELNDIIQLHRTFGKVLNDEELARAIDLRDNLKKVLTKDGRLTGGLDTGDTTDSTKPVDLFDLLHISFDDNQKDAIKSSFDFAKDQLSSFLDFQKEIAQQEVDLANEKVRQAEDNLNRQVALAAAGQANNVAEAQAQLALAKKTQEEALKQRKKAQKTELALNTALEASNLGVAIAKTLAAGLGVAGIGLVALMLGAFAAAKIKAFQLANKQTFRKGAFREIGGGSHESGNDTHVGGNNWAEKNESVGIFNAKATRKYKPTLKMFVDAANRGTLDNIIVRDQRMTRGLTSMNVNMDTSKMEKSLVKLVDIGEKKTMVSPNGDLIIVDRGRTTRIKRYGIG